MVAGVLRLKELDRQLPCDVYLWPGPRSYTRGPLAELHLLGSPPLLWAAMKALCAVGARPAEPGEFTMRAFLAGRIDLTQAEAVLGVIDAQGRQQLDTALAQLAGGLSGPLSQIREALLLSLANLEAGLDFVEEDIEFISRHELAEGLAGVKANLDDLLEQIRTRSSATAATRVVFIGSPNVGKSSLFNALVAVATNGGNSSRASWPRALVSPEAGTTRDYVTAMLLLDGCECELVDTAGTDARLEDALSVAAQKAGAAQRSQSQLKILCIDATRPLDDSERQWLDATRDERSLVVLTKCDRLLDRVTLSIDAEQADMLTSSVTGEGVRELQEALRRKLGFLDVDESQVVPATALRCRENIAAAGEAIQRAQRLADAMAGDELVAAEIRIALDELGKVVGTVYTDDVLDRIFSRFCIGK